MKYLDNNGTQYNITEAKQRLAGISQTISALADVVSGLVTELDGLEDDLKPVAFSGSYNDLSNKPTIPDVSTKVSKSGDNVTGDIDFYDGGVGFYPDSGHLNGIHGAGGTMWVAFNDAGDTMYVGNLGSNAKRITIDSTGIYINGYKIATLNDIPSAAVSGVKGNTETDYRTGNVNITAANIGAVRYDTSSQGLTSTQKSNARTNLGLGSAATYAYSSFATSTQGGYADDYHTLSTTAGQFHASVFRGKYLGSSFTSAQKAAIADGSFDDLFVGDYWTINGINWRIVDINYFLNSYNTFNHLVIMPDEGLYAARMHSTATTSTGYAGSEMFTTGINTALTSIRNAFPTANVAQFQAYFSNAASDGVATGHVRKSVYAAIPTMSMFFGVGAKYTSNVDYNGGSGKNQFALFKMSNALVRCQGGHNEWTCDIASASQYNLVNGSNVCDILQAANATAVYVRPYFCLKGA